MSNAVHSQSQIFLDSEADQWFERNRSVIESGSPNHETSTITRVLEAFKPNINRILEIGCSNGAKLATLCDYFDAKGEGVDPSAAAVNSGNAAFATHHKTNIHLQVATASDLPFETASFDLVYFGFCLYLVDREALYRAVAEADRVLKNGGFLAIFDFDPALRHKRPYHHKPGVFSYKTSYADFFTAGGHYYLVAKESFSHAGSYFATDSNERVSVSVLYKEPDAY